MPRPKRHRTTPLAFSASSVGSTAKGYRKPQTARARPRLSFTRPIVPGRDRRGANDNIPMPNSLRKHSFLIESVEEGLECLEIHSRQSRSCQSQERVHREFVERAISAFWCYRCLPCLSPRVIQPEPNGSDQYSD